MRIQKLLSMGFKGTWLDSRELEEFEKDLKYKWFVTSDEIIHEIRKIKYIADTGFPSFIYMQANFCLKTKYDIPEKDMEDFMKYAYEISKMIFSGESKKDAVAYLKEVLGEEKLWK